VSQTGARGLPGRGGDGRLWSLLGVLGRRQTAQGRPRGEPDSLPGTTHVTMGNARLTSQWGRYGLLEIYDS
jgi:hypothetical protein